jgi:hypothetical protein
MAIVGGYYVDTTASANHPALARAPYSVDNEIASHVARADSADGLKMTTTMDESNRPIRTFKLVPGATKASTWMRPFMGDAHEMLRLCSTPQTPQQNAAWEARRVSAADLKSGNFQLPEF